MVFNLDAFRDFALLVSCFCKLLCQALIRLGQQMLKTSKSTFHTQELDILYYLIGLAASLTAAVIQQATRRY